MKLKTLLACLALLLSAPASGFAGAKANLSGTWTLDKEKSFSDGPGFDQTMTITHSGNVRFNISLGWLELCPLRFLHESFSLARR